MKTSILLVAILFRTQLVFAAGACDLPLFSGGRHFAAGAGSQFVVTADFNNDGIADLAVLNQGKQATGTGTITILLGNGDGTFQSLPNITLAVNQDPTWAGAADFNGDGKPDLAVYINSNRTVVMLGNGDGTFKVGATIGANTLAIGDFNGDGKPDLVVAATPVGIMLGKGDGTFQNPINSPGTQLPSGAVVADFNGDGKLDVVTANYIGTGVFVLLGDGTGKLSAPTNFGSNKWDAFPNQIGVADLNGDHRLDIVTLDAFNDQISVLLGNGNGTFSVGNTYKLHSSMALQSTALVAADLNGDGIPDVAVTHETGAFPMTNAGTISIFTGNGDGTFQPSADYYPTGQVNYGLAAADFNGDGLADLVYVSSAPQYSPTQVGVMLGAASGTFSAPLLFNTGVSNPIGALQFGPHVLADFNGDGILDLAVLTNPVGANPLANGNNLLVAIGNGDGTFQPPTSYQTANGALYMAVGDFNNDGKPDLVISNGFAMTMLVFLGNGDGTFQAPKVTTAGIIGALPVVGDFNKDGKLDVVVRGAVLLGNGDGTFRSSFVKVNAWVAADLNGDGNLDLVDYVNGGVGQVSVQLGNGDGTFQPAVSYTSGANGQSVSVGDLNGDGIPDIVVPTNDGTLAVLLGNGDGTFQTAVHYAAAVGNQPRFAALADFNGDGFLDMAVGSTGDNGSDALAVILGNGDGTFRDALFYGLPGDPAWVAVGDVNGDQQPDLVIGSSVMVTLLNTHVAGSGSSACTPFPPLANWAPGTFQFPGT